MRWLLRCLGMSAMIGLAMAGTATAHEFEAGSLKIVHPWTMEPEKGATAVVVSMTIHNSGAAAERLLSASSPFAATAEFRHGKEETETGGPVEIPAGGSVKLRAGDLHLRLAGVSEPLSGYEMFPLTLNFETAGKVDIEVMVEEHN